jgi:hypothetical protein
VPECVPERCAGERPRSVWCFDPHAVAGFSFGRLRAHVHAQTAYSLAVGFLYLTRCGKLVATRPFGRAVRTAPEVVHVQTKKEIVQLEKIPITNQREAQ